ncbi:restriction endonuclease [Campylobacter sp. IFREMER_LSEM_CL2101]|uniref:restriction endonuclease n=1 Tax=Campylobacter sp. IFREMER_LSEM_CL2101 TaxID=2911618 RepID=UPI000B40217B|nr:restriction endonuclease [Campylobacter sp. IFREMER_LSEM_CL2101]MCV3392005.1 restriction endonuclease [Campylobacter sp. IFREMER_LSEM_CL2101]
MIEYLENIVNFLQNNPIVLDNKNEDGRINSATNEDEILKTLNQNFKNIKKPYIRSWYDFSIIDKEEIYINIKISDLDNNAADNCSSKLGMGYALSGIKNMPISWDAFHKMLAKELKIGYDYYFLVINKNNTKDCFYTSLKRIQYLVPNGNNLPFQCDWSKNRNFSNRSELESIKYILDIYLQSWDKKIKGYPFELKEMLINNKILHNE